MSTLLETPTVDLARECLYRFFSIALSDPRGGGLSELQDPENRCLIAASADVLREEAEADPVPLGFGERPATDLDPTLALADFAEPNRDRIADFDRVFGLVTFRECLPYETEYCLTEDPFFRAQQLADAAGFYRAFGLMVGRHRPERPDHIALELGFMAHLLMMSRLTDDESQAEICADAAGKFFRDHLAWWVPSFASGLRRRADGTIYANIAVALAAFLPAERTRFGVKAPKAPVRPRGIDRPAEEPEGCAGCTAGA
jgi:TorA maturation chaperone TorD